MLLNATNRYVHWPNEENTLAGNDVIMLVNRYLQSQPVTNHQKWPFQNHPINNTVSMGLFLMTYRDSLESIYSFEFFELFWYVWTCLWSGIWMTEYLYGWAKSCMQTVFSQQTKFLRDLIHASQQKTIILNSACLHVFTKKMK